MKVLEGLGTLGLFHKGGENDGVLTARYRSS